MVIAQRIGGEVEGCFRVRWKSACPGTLRRYPCAWWFVWLALVKGIPAAFSVDSAISTPEVMYADWTLILWGVQLIVAAGTAALGLATCDLKVQHYGFALLAVATVYDLIAIFYYFGTTRPAYVLLYAGFAIACTLRSLPSYRQWPNGR